MDMVTAEVVLPLRCWKISTGFPKEFPVSLKQNNVCPLSFSMSWKDRFRAIVICRSGMGSCTWNITGVLTQPWQRTNDIIADLNLPMKIWNFILFLQTGLREQNIRKKNFMKAGKPFSETSSMILFPVLLSRKFTMNHGRNMKKFSARQKSSLTR